MLKSSASVSLASAVIRTAAGRREETLVALQQGSFRPDLDQDSAKVRIRCPLCRWQPERSSRWLCLPCGHPEHFDYGCGHAWNTFDTRGRCPGCNYQWRNTSCLSCRQWSLHEDWYEPEPRGGSRPAS